MPPIKRRNKKTGNIVEFEWTSDQPPTDSDIAAIESAQAGKGSKIESRGLLDDVKAFFMDPIPDLAASGDEGSRMVTGADPGRKFGPIGEILHAMATSTPSAGLMPEESTPESRGALRGTFGGALEGISRVPSPVDVATLGLGGVARGAASAPAKIAKGLDLVSGGVNTGAGLGELASGIGKGDLASIAQGVLRTALGSAGVAANKDVLPNLGELVPDMRVRRGDEPSLFDSEQQQFPPVGPPTEDEIPEVIRVANEQANVRQPGSRAEFNESIDSIRRQRSEPIPTGHARVMNPSAVQEGYLTGDLPQGDIVPLEQLFKEQLGDIEPIPSMGDVNLSERGAVGGSPLAKVAELEDEKLASEVKLWKDYLTDEFAIAEPDKASAISIRLSQVEDEIAKRADPANKLVKLIQEAKPARERQQTGYTEQKLERANQLKDIQANMKGEEATNLSKAVLSGSYDKPAYDPVRPKLSDQDVESLFQRINESDLDTFQKARTGIALQKLLDEDAGAPPQMNELELLDKVFGEDLSQALLARRTMGQKVGDLLSDVASVPRALASSLDLSAPLRQGKILSLSNPKEALKAFGSQLRAFGSEKYFKAVESQIFSRPNVQLYEDSGLYLARKHTINRSAKEEVFQSNLAEKIPGVLASERAYVTFLNKLRADVFDKQVDAFAKMGITPKSDPDVFKGLASWINIATGRGSLGKFEKLSGPLTTIFFSPRFQASRLALLNPATYVKLPSAVRKMALKNMGIMFGVQTTLLSLLSLRDDVSVESDPRSSDFGKVKKGETRLDPWAGLQPWARLVAQLRLDKALVGDMTPLPTEGGERSAERRSPNTGKVSNPNRYSLMENFTRNKLAPLPAAIVDIFKEKTVTGKDVNWETTMAHFIPIIFQDIENMLEYSGDEYKGIPVPSGFREDVAPEFIIPAILGEGVTTYDKR